MKTKSMPELFRLSLSNTTLCLVLLAVFTGLLTSCVRNTIDDPLPEEINGLTVPSNFDWSTLKDRQLTVVPSDSYNGSFYYLIEIFNGNPVTDSLAELVAQGVAKKNQPFVVDVSIPTVSSVLYIRQTDPLKQKIVQSLQVDSNVLVCDFNEDSLVYTAQLASGGVSIPVLRNVSSTTYDTPNDAVALSSNLSDPITLVQNTAYVIPTGSTYTGKITFRTGSSLYIEGTLDVSAANAPALETSNLLVIQQGGTAQLNNGSMQTSSAKLVNFGTFKLASLGLTSTASIENTGLLMVENAYSTTNKDNSLLNDGSASFGSVSLVNGSIVNNGTMHVEGLLYANGADVENNSALVAQNLTTSGSNFYINCGTYVNETLLDESGSVFFLKEGTILKAATLDGSGLKIRMESSTILEVEKAIFNGNSSHIYGEGRNYALCHFGSVEAGNGSYKCIYYSGKLEIECSDHFQGINQWNPFYSTDNKVRWAADGEATTEIATTDCNGDGNSIVLPGTEPEDQTFPIEVPVSTVYTFIMEDNWPSVGDYDMNDVVVSLRFSYSQNSDNKVVAMTVGYTLKAVGAKKSIAAAFQLDEVLPGNVSGIQYTSTSMLTDKIFPKTVAGYESGQSKVVVPLFDGAHSYLNPENTQNAMLNTWATAPYYQPVTNQVKITFAEPLDPTVVNLENLNFFIVPDGIDASTNRTEIHLSGFSPTDKADVSRFGKYYDNSVLGNWYTTPGNLVWGLMIPVDFKYASETISIVKAYPSFSGWCTSGGIENTYWYLNPSSEDSYLY